MPLGAYSTNGGTTWTAFASHPMTTDGGTIAVSADGNTFVWSANDGKVYYTANSGATWAASAGAPSKKAVVSDRVDARKFYIFDASASTVYASTDAGATFTKMNQSAPNSGSLVASFAAEGDLWIASNTGLYHSTDSGVTFTVVGTVQEGYSVSFGKPVDDLSYPALYLAGKVGGTQAIFRSTDKGATWTRVNDDQHQYGCISVISGDPRVFGRVYIGANGRGVVYGEQKAN